MRRNDAAPFRTGCAVSDAWCAIADTICAVSDTQGARARSPYNPHAQARSLSALRLCASEASATRWHVVCRLLASPAAESRRLGKLLTGWPATVRRHLQADDCRRRLWKRGNA